MTSLRLYNKFKKPLKLYWWQYDYPNKLNFGDEITRDIILALWGRKCGWSPPSECELAGAGSIIEILEQISHGNPIKVWGSGYIKASSHEPSKNLDFYAVRGQLTRGRISNTRQLALGDPGLLSNLAYKRSNQIRYKVGIVAHYVDADHPSLVALPKNGQYKLINPLQTPEKVIAEITSCEFILSSSLHGLIVADSFGIPNMWMPLSDSVTGGDYKYQDYYSSIGKDLVSFDHERILDVEYAETSLNNYLAIKELDGIQSRLIRSFPC